MSGSKHFAQLAQKIIEESDRSGTKEREQRWRARQLMQKLHLGDLQQKANMVADDGEKKVKSKEVSSNILACACGNRCCFGIVLANLSRVLWVAYEEYELLHVCYTELYSTTKRAPADQRVQMFWKTFVMNPNLTAAHKHIKELLKKCKKERSAHLKEKATLPLDPVAPLHRGLLSRLLDPFSYVKCRCLRCLYLDAVMDYRVALFALMAEYCHLFKNYARLYWSSESRLSPSGRKVIVTSSDLDLKMLGIMLKELYTATSFYGEAVNEMKSLSFLRDLIYR